MQYNTAISYQDDGLRTKRNWNVSFHQQLVNEVDSLIRNKGEYVDGGYHLDFDDLDEDEQATLVMLQLEDDDRDTSECYYDASEYPKNDNVTCALIKMLKNNNPETQEDFATAVLKNTIKRYRTHLSELMEDRCGWVTKDFHDSKGYDE